MKESWQKWEPLDGLAAKYYVDALEVNEDHGLTLTLATENRDDAITVCWDGVVISYMCSEESARNTLWDEPARTQWTFFRVPDSGYCQWLESQSLGIYQQTQLRHFCITGANSVVDVVATYEPLIKRCM